MRSRVRPWLAVPVVPVHGLGPDRAGLHALPAACARAGVDHRALASARQLLAAHGDPRGLAHDRLVAALLLVELVDCGLDRIGDLFQHRDRRRRAVELASAMVGNDDGVGAGLGRHHRIKWFKLRA